MNKTTSSKSNKEKIFVKYLWLSPRPFSAKESAENCSIILFSSCSKKKVESAGVYFICSFSSKSAQKYHLGRKLCPAWKQTVLPVTEKYQMEIYKFHNNFEPVLVGYLKFHHLQALQKRVFRPRQPHLQALQPRNQNPNRCRSLIRRQIPDFEHLKLNFKSIKLSKLWYFKFAIFSIKYERS